MLTPINIENKEFKKAIFGYEKLDVEEFLNTVLESYEALYKENIALKDKVTMLSDGIKQYKTMEETLQNTLVVAQSAGEEVKRSAQASANTIIKDAEFNAEQIIIKAKNDARGIIEKSSEMKQQLIGYKAKMNALISTQINILNEINFEKDEKILEFHLEPQERIEN